MRLLDLFCGAGGAAVGYSRAGFEVVGVDIEPQPNFPFEFHQFDVMEPWPETIKLEDFDLVHASPPCQGYSVTRTRHNGRGLMYPRLVPQVRELVRTKPYVIENVQGAPLRQPLMLCGTMFPNLRVIRHRLFETNVGGIVQPSHTFPHPPLEYASVHGANFTMKEASAAMQIDWMKTVREMAEAIPPKYTEYIGKQLMPALISRRASRKAGE